MNSRIAYKFNLHWLIFLKSLLLRKCICYCMHVHVDKVVNNNNKPGQFKACAPRILSSHYATWSQAAESDHHIC